MRRENRRNLVNKISSILLLIVALVVIIFSIYKIFIFLPEGIVLDVIALIATGLFCIFEIIVIIIRFKKEGVLKNIAFTESENINTFPLVMVSIGAVFGLGLTILGFYIYFAMEEIETKSNILIILSIGLFLLVNCVIYYIYLLMFRKREFKMEDLIK